MEQYEAPKLEIILFDHADVIVTSDPTSGDVDTGGGTDWGE